MAQTAAHPHITSHRIVSEQDPMKLGGVVDSAIHNGWQPHGSLAVHDAAEGVVYSQPRVKYAEWFR